jgi:hypothetical protein
MRTKSHGFNYFPRSLFNLQKLTFSNTGGNRSIRVSSLKTEISSPLSPHFDSIGKGGSRQFSVYQHALDLQGMEHQLK